MRSHQAQVDGGGQTTDGGSAAGPAPMLAGGNQMMLRLMRTSEAVSVQREVDIAGKELEPAVSGPPLPLRAIIPSVNYYQQRFKDFVRRNPGKTPPDYYLGYGDVYAHRFTQELKPKLSPEGQQWVDRALRLLQEYIEDRRDADPEGFAALELEPGALQTFAYDTHPAAYTNAGLATLPATDLWAIVKTPNFEHLATMDGVAQIFVTAGIVYGEWAARYAAGTPQM